METLHPEYQAVNGSQTDKYSQPKRYIVRWYNKFNELQEHPTASRELAERMAFYNKGTFTSREV